MQCILCTTYSAYTPYIIPIIHAWARPSSGPTRDAHVIHTCYNWSSTASFIMYACTHACVEQCINDIIVGYCYYDL